MTARASEEGALHNRQICPQARKAAKLSVLSPQITVMWNNSAFCLWCFSSSCLLLLLPYHFMLSWVDLQKCTEISPSPLSVTLYSFSPFVAQVLSCMHSYPTDPPVLLCVSCLCSLAVFWIPKCSEYKPEGEWFLTSWSGQFTFTHTVPLVGNFSADIAHIVLMWHATILETLLVLFFLHRDKCAYVGCLIRATFLDTHLNLCTCIDEGTPERGSCWCMKRVCSQL